MVYHDLKMICHIPLAMFVNIWPALRASLPARTLQHISSQMMPAKPESPSKSELPNQIGGAVTLSPSVVANLTMLRSMVVAHYSAILRADRFDSTAQRLRQVQLVEATVSFLTRILSAQPPAIDLEHMVEFTRSIAVNLDHNLNDAAAAQVSLLNDVFSDLNRTYRLSEYMGPGTQSPNPLRHLNIAVTTSHMARVQTLAAQYLSRFFGVSIDTNDRFMTLEQLSTEQQVLKLLDTAQTDLAMGWAFFGDMYRMQEDALCHGAKKALDRLFPQSANSTEGCLPSY